VEQQKLVGASAVGAGDAAASLEKCLANLVAFGRNVGKIKAKFGQHQNLALPKHSNSYGYVWSNY